MSEAAFADTLTTLICAGQVVETGNLLFAADRYNELEAICRQKKAWSRQLFQQHRTCVRWVTRLPWIKYVGLTGANAFESCRQRDDIDLFIVTARHRLWLTYLILVVLSKLLGKRELLCVNYLVDEDHPGVPQHNYYTAVQITQMVSLYNPAFKNRLLEANAWVFDCLPNMRDANNSDAFYLLEEAKRNFWPIDISALSRLNRLIFQHYAARLHRKYPHLIGHSLILQEGMAKLHRNDHSHIYADTQK